MFAALDNPKSVANQLPISVTADSNFTALSGTLQEKASCFSLPFLAWLLLQERVE
jgi:hypothetical protein